MSSCERHLESAPTPVATSDLWGAVHKNIISDRFSTKTAISAYI